ncbi:MAG TPA: type II secretion system protein [Tepidisphaeraceae bacterium]
MKHDRRSAGFTLVELLVCVGIIALLISMLMPALQRVRAQANSVQCKSNMEQIGYELQIYSQNNRDWMFPVGPWDDVKKKYKSFGTNVDPSERWMVYVFKMNLPETPSMDPAVYTPPIMLCPSDLEPAAAHSYILNKHLAKSPEELIKYSTKTNGKSKDEIVLMGEKVTIAPDYYMELSPQQDAGVPGSLAPYDPTNSEFFKIVDPYKHGLKLGSNYLYMDLHVDTDAPKNAADAVDPWDPRTPPTGPVERS